MIRSSRFFVTQVNNIENSVQELKGDITTTHKIKEANYIKRIQSFQDGIAAYQDVVLPEERKQLKNEQDQYRDNIKALENTSKELKSFLLSIAPDHNPPPAPLEPRTLRP